MNAVSEDIEAFVDAPPVPLIFTDSAARRSRSWSTKRATRT